MLLRHYSDPVSNSTRPGVWIAIALIAFLIAGSMIDSTDSLFEIVVLGGWLLFGTNALVRAWWRTRREVQVRA